MHPVIFEIGSIPVRAYGLALAVSFLVGSWLALRRGTARGLPEEDLLGLFGWIVVSSVLGARLHYILAHPDHFAGLVDAFRIWEGGLIQYGGLAAAVVAGWVYLRRKGLPFLPVADVIAPSLALGEGITRIGCHFNGCCFGDVCGGSWAIHYPAESYAAQTLGTGTGVWPSQLFLSGALFLSAGVLLLAGRRRHAAGALFALYLVLEGIARYAVDFSRYYEPSEQVVWGGALLESQSQVRALALVGLGLLLWLWARRRGTAR